MLGPGSSLAFGVFIPHVLVVFFVSRPTDDQYVVPIIVGMRPFVFSLRSILGLCLILSTQVAQANDTAFGGTASDPYPIHTDEIRMVSEDITIKSNAEDGSWIYTCEFKFKNMSRKTVNLLMGMPFSKRIKSDDERLSIPIGAKAPPDGQPLVWIERLEPLLQMPGLSLTKSFSCVSFSIDLAGK